MQVDLGAGFMVAAKAEKNHLILKIMPDTYVEFSLTEA